VLLPERTVENGAVLLRNGRIAHAGAERRPPKGAALVDAQGGWIAPGLIDLHIHGAGADGVGTADRAGLARIRDALLRRGILRWVPTMMADEAMIRRTADALADPALRRHMPGLYVEGPFLRTEKRGGVQARTLRDVDPATLRHLQEIAGGRIRFMTLAPELPGAEALPAALRALRIQPAFGHSDCTAGEARAAAGRRRILVTHLFNGMSGLDHHRPGLAAWALTAPNSVVELNPDGRHVAPELLTLAGRLLPPERIALISDAVPGAGVSDGSYRYAGRDVRVDGDGVHYAGDGTLVGSACLLNEGVGRFLRHTRLAPHTVMQMATLTPARILGISRRTGSLEQGKNGDIAIFSRCFRTVRGVFLQGHPVSGSTVSDQ
jgi:N-acetylglucosamine-6-phosphate deacetylase